MITKIKIIRESNCPISYGGVEHYVNEEIANLINRDNIIVDINTIIDNNSHLIFVIKYHSR